MAWGFKIVLNAQNIWWYSSKYLYPNPFPFLKQIKNMGILIPNLCVGGFRRDARKFEGNRQIILRSYKVTDKKYYIIGRRTDDMTHKSNRVAVLLSIFNTSFPLNARPTERSSALGEWFPHTPGVGLTQLFVHRASCATCPLNSTCRIG